VPASLDGVAWPCPSLDWDAKGSRLRPKIHFVIPVAAEAAALTEDVTHPQSGVFAAVSRNCIATLWRAHGAYHQMRLSLVFQDGVVVNLNKQFANGFQGWAATEYELLRALREAIAACLSEDVAVGEAFKEGRPGQCDEDAAQLSLAKKAARSPPGKKALSVQVPGPCSRTGSKSCLPPFLHSGADAERKTLALCIGEKITASKPLASASEFGNFAEAFEGELAEERWDTILVNLLPSGCLPWNYHCRTLHGALRSSLTVSNCFEVICMLQSALLGDGCARQHMVAQLLRDEHLLQEG